MRQQNHLVLTTNCTIFITLIKSFSIRPLLFRHPTSKPVRTYLLGLVLFYEEEAGKLQLKRYYFKSNFFKKQRKFKITTRSCDIHQDKLHQENWFLGLHITGISTALLARYSVFSPIKRIIPLSFSQVLLRYTPVLTTIRCTRHNHLKS